jgi:hypothetical protein
MRYFFLFIFIPSILSGSLGSINGVVLDADTHQPLPGANIILHDSVMGTASNEEGHFNLSHIPVGSYTITVSMIGYESLSRGNVNIYSQRQTSLKFLLTPAVLEGETVTVKAGYFEKAKDGIVSTQTIGIEEIRSDPIGAYDIQMMLQSLPSISVETDQNNEIIVRGGGPGENLFIMDHLEIPNPNHFGEMGTGGGPVNILNTEFVERIDFFAGGFPARYGDKMSSVMDISLREGNAEKMVVDTEMSMAGVGLLTEGPFANGKGTYIGSVRQSFLKYIIKSAGLTAVPEYWNTQWKVVYNLSPRRKLMWNTVGGADYIKIENESRPDLKGAENVEYSGNQFTSGITYKSLFSDRGYSLLSAGESTSNWVADVFWWNNGVKDTYFDRNNTETDDFLKWDIVYKISNTIEVSGGINTKYGSYELKEIVDPDTLRFYQYPDLSLSATRDDYYTLIEENPDYEYMGILSDTLGVIHPGLVNQQSGGLWKYAGYTQLKNRWKQFTVTAGLRYDHVPFNDTKVVSPRLGIKYHFSPITKVNIAIGEYQQAPNYWMLLNPRNESPLKHTYTKQQIAGIEHFFADDIRGTIEVYKKTYHNQPVPRADITADSLDARIGFVDNGESWARGVEVFLQKKFARKWYGTFSFSHINTEQKDHRAGKEGYIPADFDGVNSLTVVGGYKFKFRQSKWYQELRNSAFFPYISWIPFMASDQLELSFRYRYSDGRLYTPKKYDFRHRIWYTDAQGELNTERYDYYSRFDFMILRRFNFEKINLTTFLDFQNIFDRNNEWERVYLDDGTWEMSYQYKQMPVGGIIIEF